MNEDIRNVLKRITSLEDELVELVQNQQSELKYRFDGTRLRFEESIREAHKQLKVSTLRWLAHGEFRNMITAPVIYSLVVPIALLDLAVSVYQALCFPLYRVPRVKRSTYIVIDRHNLRYLNSIERLNCVYCGYAGGVFAFAREIAARTEQYWCPIKHARKIIDQHRRYIEFCDFGDADNYREVIAGLRQELAEEYSQQQR